MYTETNINMNEVRVTSRNISVLKRLEQMKGILDPQIHQGSMKKHSMQAREPAIMEREFLIEKKNNIWEWKFSQREKRNKKKTKRAIR